MTSVQFSDPPPPLMNPTSNTVRNSCLQLEGVSLSIALRKSDTEMWTSNFWAFPLLFAGFLLDGLCRTAIWKQQTQRLLLTPNVVDAIETSRWCSKTHLLRTAVDRILRFRALAWISVTLLTNYSSLLIFSGLWPCDHHLRFPALLSSQERVRQIWQLKPPRRFFSRESVSNVAEERLLWKRNMLSRCFSTGREVGTRPSLIIVILHFVSWWRESNLLLTSRFENDINTKASQ